MWLQLLKNKALAIRVVFLAPVNTWFISDLQRHDIPHTSSLRPERNWGGRQEREEDCEGGLRRETWKAVQQHSGGYHLVIV